MGRTSTRPALAVAVAVTALLALAPAAGAANGRLVFSAAGNLILQPQSGKATVIGGRQASIIGSSRSGKLMAYSSGTDGDVTVADARGRIREQMNFAGIVVHSLDISPNGKMLALTAFRDAERGPVNIFPYIARIDGKRLTRVRTRVLHTFDLRFTRDGKYFVYAGAPSTGDFTACASLRRVRLDGAQDESLYEATGGPTPCVVNVSLSPGGSTAAFTGDPAPGQPLPPGMSVRSSIYRVSMSGRGTPRLVTPGAFAAAWSPAGDQIAYSTIGGTYRISQFGGPATQVSRLATLSLTWLKAT
jgi:Tol biopolymer transport system component